MSFEIDYDGDLIWTNEKDQCHREKGPAIIYTNGGVEYIFKGKFDRLDGPAAIYHNGDKEYWINDIEYTKEEYYAKVKKL